MEKIYNISEPTVVYSPHNELYAYTAYIGKHDDIPVMLGDSAWVVTNEGVKTIRGKLVENYTISSEELCVIIRGYAPDNKSSGYETMSNLPYVNGCTSNQLIAPLRIGDPTAQLLFLPKFTQEQAHHIHSTARIVYVLKGKGKSIQGMPDKNGGNGSLVEIDLSPGKVIILDKNIPHHFETEDSELVVIPIHIFSSTPLEYNHPMFNGTFKVDNV